MPTAFALTSCLCLVTMPACAQTGEKPAPTAETDGEAEAFDEQTREALDQVLEAYIEKHGIPGLSAAIALGGNVIWSRGYGLADVENDVPARPETAYRSASIGKTITATAALQLVERHELDRPIQDYSAVFPPKPWVITARHLLSHTAGIRHYGGPRDREEQTSLVHYASVADALAPFKDDPLLFEPGTQYSYSTYGYNVLACVLEGAARMEFMDVVRRNVFEPCGMADSRADDPSAIVTNRAAGYVRLEGELRNATHVDMSNRLPAGGYLTTAPDLARFAANFIDGRLVSRATRDAMLAHTALRNGDTVNYGLGWGIGEDAAGHPDGTAFHGGSTPGASGQLYIDLGHRLGVAFLTNLEDAPERLETVRAMAAIVAERVPPVAAVCAVPEADRAWIERALEAWRFTSREITGIGSVPRFRAIFFSADCVLTSDDALSSPTAQGVTWTAAPHAGAIALPNGSEIPAGVVSFTSGEKGLTYFVMSTPSVWRAGGVGDGPDLERTMVAVLLHEASHVAQVGPYGPRLGALIEQYALPDSFSDDTLQERFQSNQEFAASVARETQLFLKAAAAAEDDDANVLAYEARELMRERQARWLVGDDACFFEAEDVWLTFEGAGQWAAYQWLVHPQGGAQEPAAVMPRFARGRWWSQTEGFAVVSALERIVGPAWKRHAFGDGEKTVLEMLDAALAEH